jgi:5-methyltetrahydrofolate--homocysteine methyltransferase
MQDVVEKLASCIAKGKISRSAWFPPEMKDQDGAEEIAAEALKNGIQPDVILKGCMMGMDRVGKAFSEKTAFVSHLILAGEAMNAVMKQIKPFLESGNVTQKGTFVIGTVAGDLHDIGKNLVSIMIRGGGFNVIDLGMDVPTAGFLEAVAQHPGCFVGLSALLTTTMRNMEESVKAIKEKFPDSKVLIGGAPINQDFCTRIGADFYSPNPHEAVEFLNKSV